MGEGGGDGARAAVAVATEEMRGGVAAAMTVGHPHVARTHRIRCKESMKNRHAKTRWTGEESTLFSHHENRWQSALGSAGAWAMTGPPRQTPPAPTLLSHKTTMASISPMRSFPSHATVAAATAKAGAAVEGGAGLPVGDAAAADIAEAAGHARSPPAPAIAARHTAAPPRGAADGDPVAHLPHRLWGQAVGVAPPPRPRRRRRRRDGGARPRVEQGQVQPPPRFWERPSCR